MGTTKKTESAQPARIVHNIAQVADLLDLSRGSVNKLVRDRELRTFTIGSRRMVSHDALLEFIRTREAAEAGRFVSFEKVAA